MHSLCPMNKALAQRLTPYSLDECCIDPYLTQINMTTSSPCHKCSVISPFSAGIVFRRHILTSKDGPRTGIKIKQKKPTKPFMVVSNWTKPVFSSWFMGQYLSALRVNTRHILFPLLEIVTGNDTCSPVSVLFYHAVVTWSADLHDVMMVRPLSEP